MTLQTNSSVAETFRELSELYEARKDEYRSMAFAKAANTVEGLGTPLIKVNVLTALPGIGRTSSGIVTEVLRTGKCERLEQLRKVVLLTADRKKTPRASMLLVAVPLLSQIEAIHGVKQAKLAGSIRRKRVLVRDIDIVVCCNRWDNLFVAAQVRRLLKNPGKGNTKVSGEIRVGPKMVHVDVSLCRTVEWGATLMYLTGSKASNVALRKRAKDMGFVLNEYSLWENGKRVAGRTEISIYRRLGLKMTRPENR